MQFAFVLKYEKLLKTITRLMLFVLKLWCFVFFHEDMQQRSFCSKVIFFDILYY